MYDRNVVLYRTLCRSILVPQRTQVCTVGLDGKGEKGGQHVLRGSVGCLCRNGVCLCRNGVDGLVDDDTTFSISTMALVHQMPISCATGKSPLTTASGKSHCGVAK
jgi:hypothetical protein